MADPLRSRQDSVDEGSIDCRLYFMKYAVEQTRGTTA